MPSQTVSQDPFIFSAPFVTMRKQTPGDSKAQGELVMATHVCNPSTREAFEASLRLSSEIEAK